MPAVDHSEVIQVTLNTRQPRLTRAEFQRYWREVHGPLTVQHARYTGFYHYEQWHNLDADASIGTAAGRMRAARGIPHTAEFDGVSLLFYADMAAWEASAQDRTPARKDVNRVIMRDNGNFLNVPNTPSLVLRVRYEAGALKGVHPSDLPASATRGVIVFPLVRPEGVTREQFHARWRDVHGPLVEANLAAIGGVKYAQLHTVRPGGGKWGSAMPEIDGIAVVWVDSAADKAKARTAARALLDDEREFIDLPRSFSQNVTPLFTSAQPDAWRILPYDGPVSPVATSFKWFRPPAQAKL